MGGAATRPPSTSRPQGPDHQHRLEQQSYGSRRITIQTECIDAIDILGNVPPKYGHEKQCNRPTDLHSIFPSKNQSESEQNFDQSRCQHDHICVILEYARHLCLKLGAIRSEVRGACKRKRKTQDKLCNLSHEIHLNTDQRVFNQ